MSVKTNFWLLCAALALPFLFAACTNSRKVAAGYAAGDPAGEWRGMLPCADCPGIDYTLNLHAGGHYEETMVYQERSVTPFKSEGAWKQGKDGLVTLQAAAGNVKQYFRFTGSQLIKLDGDKKEIEGPLADKFRLTRTPEGASKATQDRLSRGIVFAATGNEPFWSVELDDKGILYFKALDGPEVTGKAEKSSDRGSQQAPARYTIAQADRNLSLEVVRRNCVDDMSGAQSDWSVTAVVRQDGREITYRGCGDYMGDYRLHRVWTLREIDGQPILDQDYPDGVPTLELEMDEKRVSGFAGCNRYFGTFTLAGQMLSFSGMGSTRMACPQTMKLENQLLEALSDQKLKYQLQAGTLRLTGNGHTLVFRR